MRGLVTLSTINQGLGVAKQALKCIDTNWIFFSSQESRSSLENFFSFGIPNFKKKSLSLFLFLLKNMRHEPAQEGLAQWRCPGGGCPMSNVHLLFGEATCNGGGGCQASALPSQYFQHECISINIANSLRILALCYHFPPSGVTPMTSCLFSQFQNIQTVHTFWKPISLLQSQRQTHTQAQCD